MQNYIKGNSTGSSQETYRTTKKHTAIKLKIHLDAHHHLSQVKMGGNVIPRHHRIQFISDSSVRKKEEIPHSTHKQISRKKAQRSRSGQENIT